jgi:hypothetical protein
VAQEAMLCVEGMIVRAQMRRDPQVAAAGRRLLARIEHDAMPALPRPGKGKTKDKDKRKRKSS